MWGWHPPGTGAGRRALGDSRALLGTSAIWEVEVGRGFSVAPAVLQQIRPMVRVCMLTNILGSSGSGAGLTLDPMSPCL